MSDPKPPPPDADAEAREAARLAWEKGELEKGDVVGEPLRVPSFTDRLFGRAAVPDDEDGYVAPPKRSAFPPSFKIVLAVALGFLALEPTADLTYELFGPSEAIDLGHPADFHLDRAVDGARAKIQGFASARRGSYSSFGNEWEVVALTGTPVLVRRTPQPPAPPSTVELYQGEGRLLRLEDEPASFIERLVRPSARFANVKSTFVTYGEIPPGRTAWLLLDGDVPRGSFSDIAWPLVLWLAAISLLVSAVRAMLRPARPARRP